MGRRPPKRPAELHRRTSSLSTRCLHATKYRKLPWKNPLSKHFQGKANGLIVYSVTLCPSCSENSPFPDAPAGLSSSMTPLPLPLQCQLLQQADFGHKYHKGCPPTWPPSHFLSRLKSPKGMQSTTPQGISSQRLFFCCTPLQVRDASMEKEGERGSQGLNLHC